MGAAAAIIIGISGASGAAYGIRLLEVLQSGGIRTHLVVSKSALQTLKEEADFSFEQVRALAETTYHNTDLGAAIAGRLSCITADNR
jgi:flavin prenyltransferase